LLTAALTAEGWCQVRPVLRATALLALILAPMVIMGVALAMPAYVSTYQATGQSAYASFHASDPTGCIVTDVFVFAGNAAVHETGGERTPARLEAVRISQFDVCTQQSLFDAPGDISPFSPCQDCGFTLALKQARFDSGSWDRRPDS